MMVEQILDVQLEAHLLPRVMIMMLPLMNYQGLRCDYWLTCSRQNQDYLQKYDTKSFARVVLNNRHYNLPPWSISILLDCTNHCIGWGDLLPFSLETKIWRYKNGPG